MIFNMFFGFLLLVCAALMASLVAQSVAYGGWSFLYLTVLPLEIALVILGADQLEPLYFKTTESVFE